MINNIINDKLSYNTFLSYGLNKSLSKVAKTIDNLLIKSSCHKKSSTFESQEKQENQIYINEIDSDKDLLIKADSLKQPSNINLKVNQYNKQFYQNHINSILTKVKEKNKSISRYSYCSRTSFNNDYYQPNYNSIVKKPTTFQIKTHKNKRSICDESVLNTIIVDKSIEEKVNSERIKKNKKIKKKDFTYSINELDKSYLATIPRVKTIIFDKYSKRDITLQSNRKEEISVNKISRKSSIFNMKDNKCLINFNNKVERFKPNNSKSIIPSSGYYKPNYSQVEPILKHTVNYNTISSNEYITFNNTKILPNLSQTIKNIMPKTKFSSIKYSKEIKTKFYDDFIEEIKKKNFVK